MFRRSFLVGRPAPFGRNPKDTNAFSRGLAYSDGGVRYINHTGRMTIVEGPSSVSALVSKLFAACAPVVGAIGPWDQPRRPPPPAGALRITFLVSDGLYFGEGPFAALQRDRMAGPVIQCATELLRAVVALGRG